MRKRAMYSPVTALVLVHRSKFADTGNVTENRRSFLNFLKTDPCCKEPYVKATAESMIEVLEKVLNTENRNPDL